PCVRAATRDDAGKDHGTLLCSSTADAAGGDFGGRRQDHLDAVLDGTVGVEDQDVLRAGAHIDGEDSHGDSVNGWGSGMRSDQTSGRAALGRLTESCMQGFRSATGSKGAGAGGSLPSVRS